MKRAGKIGRLGRAAIVAAVGAVFVLLSIPAAHAGFDWETPPASDEPAQVVRHLPQPETQTAGFDWE